MSSKYPNLLSPLKIGNVVLKNRLMATNNMPHFLQGPEAFPADSLMSYFEAQAKNGAAIVTLPRRTDSLKNLPQPDLKRFAVFDFEDETVQNYMSQLADTVHFYGTKVSGDLWSPPLLTENICNTPDLEKILDEMVKDVVNYAKLLQTFGFDMGSMYAPYRASIPAQLLSPITNKRTDKFGGSLENRARFLLTICEEVKKACGQDFLLDLRFSGEEEGGTTIEDTINFAKLAEGKIDIFQLRAGTGEETSPMGYNSGEGDEPLTLHVAGAIKKSGARVIVAPSGGFQNLEENEEYITSGKADLIAMGRAWICDPEYGRKAYEGRGDDVVPCIKCHRCHVPSFTGPWVSICSVNPTFGIVHKVDRMTKNAGSRELKKVAVIGGGPAGMRAAVYAAQKGHKVTLYEKSDTLGGQIKHADYSSFKWPLRNYRDYLIVQMEKAGVKVLISTKAAPEMIKKERYDVVIAALGGKHKLPPIPGAEGNNVWTPIDVYGNESKLGKKVMVIGGSETGVETGMYLADMGHGVTLITRKDKLAYDAPPIHHQSYLEDYVKKQDNFNCILGGTTTKISDGKVTYTDFEGNEKYVETDSVVACGGVDPLYGEAVEFYGTADRFFMIGDCDKVGNVQKATRSAFAVASMI